MVVMRYTKRNEKEIVRKAVKVLKKGGLIVYPTDTVYGIGADATNKKAVSRVFKIKRRSKPISVLVWNKTMLKKYSYPSKLSLKKLPGKYTFVLKPKKKLPVSKSNIGFRIPKHWCTEISKQFGKPITTTSANLTGKKTPSSIEKIKGTFGKDISLYIDSGSLSKKPSRVIDINGKRIR